MLTTSGFLSTKMYPTKTYTSYYIIFFNNHKNTNKGIVNKNELYIVIVYLLT